MSLNFEAYSVLKMKCRAAFTLSTSQTWIEYGILCFWSLWFLNLLFMQISDLLPSCAKSMQICFSSSNSVTICTPTALLWHTLITVCATRLCLWHLPQLTLASFDTNLGQIDHLSLQWLPYFWWTPGKMICFLTLLNLQQI